MITHINEQINNFLISLPTVSEDQVELINKKSATTVTDDLKKGHATSNVCMIAASILKRNPRDLADELVSKLRDSNAFEEVESAGPGFINITFKREDFVYTVSQINQNPKDFGSSKHGINKSIQIENYFFLHK